MLYCFLVIAAALICLLVGIVIGGTLVLLADTGQEKTLTSPLDCPPEGPGEIPPIGKGPSA